MRESSTPFVQISYIHTIRYLSSSISKGGSRLNKKPFYIKNDYKTGTSGL